MSYSTDEKEGFIHRWSRLKQKEVSDENYEADAGDVGETGDIGAIGEELPPNEAAPDNMLTDADMPAIDTLDEHSDVSGFFSEKVSEELRRAALRKLFHLPTFNFTDGLNDYDEDFTRPSELLNWASQKVFSTEGVDAKSSAELPEVVAGDSASSNTGALSKEQEISSAGESDSEIERPTRSACAEADESTDEKTDEPT